MVKRRRTLAGRLGSELATGMMLGLASGAVIALVAIVWLGRGRVALCLLGGIGGGVTAAAVMGLALPFFYGSCACNLASRPVRWPWQRPMW